MGIIKWVQQAGELLSLVHECLDAKSPFPFQSRDFEEYLQRFQGSIPAAEHPDFVSSLAWSTAARASSFGQVDLPLQNCIPLKDPGCFPSGATTSFESCLECCNPKHGAAGNAECWDDQFNYDRCCQGFYIPSPPPPIPVVEEPSSVDCSGLEESARELQQELKSKTEFSQDLANELAKLKDDYNNCKGELEKEKADQAARELAVEAMEAKMASAAVSAAQNLDANQALEDAKRQVEELRETQAANEIKVASLEADVAKLDNAQKEALAKVEALNAVVDEEMNIAAQRAKALDEAQAEIRSLLEERNQLKVSEAEARNRASSLEEDMKRCSDTKESLGKEVSAKEEEISSLKRRLEREGTSKMESAGLEAELIKLLGSRPSE